MRFAVFGDDRFRFLICQVFDSLQGAQVEFHPDTLVVRIDKTIGVASESVHMAIGVRNAARAHSDCHLMRRFGQKCPEVPVAVRAAHVRFRVALDGMIQIRKFKRIT